MPVQPVSDRISTTDALPNLPRADHRREREDQQDVRDGREDVVEPLEEVVDLAAPVAGERAEHRADDGGEQRRAEADEDRDLRALDRLLQHVAAPLVAAEGQRSAPSRSPRSTSSRALVPLLVARRERVDVGEVHGGAARRCATAPCLAVGARRPEEGRVRVRDALLLPVLGDQAERRRARPAARKTRRRRARPCRRGRCAGAATPRARGRRAAPVRASRRPGCACATAATRAHLRTTLGSTNLYITSTSRLMIMVSTAR